MARINLLDRQIAELIAAGEVVERPSSVVKELVENSIDAGASSITVEIKNGGVTYIRITDDGAGIESEELPKAFLRHATSKVETQEDLYSISTLGFRGEALASIAAMSRVEVISRYKDEDMGGRYIIEGGDSILHESTGCPIGTTIVVRDIFYNTPARMKFLKKDATEASSVAGVLDRMALSHPEISFKFIRDGQLRLHTPGDGKLYSAIYTVLGKDFASGLTEVSYNSGSLSAVGYITKPECARTNRSMQFLFINNRMVRSASCSAALEEAYRGSIMTGKFPGCVLKLSIPYNVVDVNVHPAKIEVRFSNEKAIFDLVYYAAKTALDSLRPATEAAQTAPRKLGLNEFTLRNAPLVGSQQVLASNEKGKTVGEKKPHINLKFNPVKPNDFTGKVTEKLQKPLEFGSSQNYSLQGNAKTIPSALLNINKAYPVSGRYSNHTFKSEPIQSINTKDTTVHVPEVEKQDEQLQYEPRVIGQIFDTYILTQYGDELLLVDKHAAHERIIFNMLKEEGGYSQGQTLLSPVTVTLSRELYSSAVDNLSHFKKFGFLAEDFGDGSLIIREIPMLLDNEDISSLIEEIADKILQYKSNISPQALDELYHSVACKAAIKGGKATSLYELTELVNKLFKLGDIRHCPHGRPVTISFTKNDLEKMFGRRT